MIAHRLMPHAHYHTTLPYHTTILLFLQDVECILSTICGFSEERGNVSFFRLIKDHSGCCILDQLQRLHSRCRKARQESMTIVQSGENKSLDKELCGLL